MFVLHNTDSTYLLLKFVERYTARNAGGQSQIERVRKVAASPPKIGRRNIDDTDSCHSSSDDESYSQVSSTADAYLEEWNLYLNTNEIVPDDIGIIGWWGVRCVLLPVA